MAVFTSYMPGITGDTKTDVAELQSWARKLIYELRAILYSLDTDNVISARSVKAENISGTLNGGMLSAVPAEKISGTAPVIEVDAENGIVLTDSDGNVVARIFYSDSSQRGLHIEADSLYCNNVKIE